MDNPIVISLAVSGIGMLMLFVALTLLYGLMYLMTALLKDQPTNKPTNQLTAQPTNQLTNKLQVAVIAVALARAEQDLDNVGAVEAQETASAWRALHHQRQLTRNLPTRRTR